MRINAIGANTNYNRNKSMNNRQAFQAKVERELLDAAAEYVDSREKLSVFKKNIERINKLGDENTNIFVRTFNMPCEDNTEILEAGLFFQNRNIGSNPSLLFIDGLINPDNVYEPEIAFNTLKLITKEFVMGGEKGLFLNKIIQENKEPDEALAEIWDKVDDDTFKMLKDTSKYIKDGNYENDISETEIETCSALAKDLVEKYSA